MAERSRNVCLLSKNSSMELNTLIFFYLQKRHLTNGFDSKSLIHRRTFEP